MRLVFWALPTLRKRKRKRERELKADAGLPVREGGQPVTKYSSLQIRETEGGREGVTHPSGDRDAFSSLNLCS